MITALQTRLAALLGASAYFAGVTILVDTKPDFVNAVAEAIARQDLVVLVGFAEGQALEPYGTRPALRESIRVAVIQHRLHTAHSAVDLVEKAMGLLHNQPIVAHTGTPSRFYVSSHRSDVDEDGTIAAELTVTTEILIN
jgi:hypothetical protein